MLRVLDARLGDLQPVDLGGERRGDHGAGAVLRVAQMPGGACRVCLGHGLQLQRADRLAALAEGHGVAVHGLELAQLHARESKKLMADALEMLGDDEEAESGNR